MAKKTESGAVAVLDAKSAYVVAFDDAGALAAFAAEVGVEIEGSCEERADAAAVHMSRSQRHMLAAGALLGSIKAECDHGAFAGILQERGFESRAAQRAMQYVRYLMDQSGDVRARLIAMHQSKVMALSSADPEVVAALLGGTESFDTLSVRALRDRIRELEAQAVDTDAQLESAAAEAKALKKKLARPGSREDQIPMVVADLRAEAVALAKKAELAVQSLGALRADIAALGDSPAAQDWADATLRLALSSLLALRSQMDGEAAAYLKLVPGGDATPKPASYLTSKEVREAALAYRDLTKAHAHEAELRTWEREQDRPRGKGRPSNKPEAPEGSAA